MIRGNTDAYKKLYARFLEAFGEGIPLYVIPEKETIEGLTASVERCIAEGRNMIYEIYNVKTDGSVIY